ncbi:MAG: CRISPR-associated protein Cas4, partial [archaeon]|nr:CRISPR-associated protein Cas4 [archaeon]
MDNRIISVSDLNSWLYCSRKLYLTRISKLQVSPNRNMMIGKIKHSILENFSKREETFISSFEKDYDKLDLAFMYEDFLKGISNLVFIENKPIIDKFLIDKEDIFKKVMRDFSEDIKLRIQSIKEVTSKGIFRENICKHLDSVYLSEVRLESPQRGLRGRVDRIMISKNTGEIIPFELKSREERIFHSDEIQLAAYAILLEDYYKVKIEKGFVEVGN